MRTLEEFPFGASTLPVALEEPCAGLEFFWLGQAGFLFRSPGLSWVIDPYLSDRLADKYRGHAFSHARLMPPPLTPSELPPLDWVFCTHHHGDHLDLPTLRDLAQRHPTVRFALPAGSQAEAGHWGLPDGRITWAEAGVPFEASAGLEVVPVKAAHEEFAYDAAGRHRFLGFAFRHPGGTIYHSGDTVPFPGLSERLRDLAPDVALLPVNGRRPELAAQGIAGNLSLAEAVAVCREAGVPAMVAHHFGMFAFNTIAPEAIDAVAREHPSTLRLFRARTGVRYRMKPIA